MHSWRVLLLPFFEGSALASQYDLNEPWDGPNNRKLIPFRPPPYVLHGLHDAEEGVTNYLAVVGRDTFWPGETCIRESEITDDRATTLMVVENYGANVLWTEPRDLEFPGMEMNLRAESPRGISSRYSPPAAAMADASVRKLALEIPVPSLRALLTIRANDDVGLDDHFQPLRDGRERPLKPVR